MAMGVNIFGSLSSNGQLSGRLSMVAEYESYDGTYEITPKAFETQMLNTAGKVLGQNIQIKEIPYYETDNKANGKTAYIAKEE